MVKTVWKPRNVHHKMRRNVAGTAEHRLFKTRTVACEEEARFRQELTAAETGTDIALAMSPKSWQPYLDKRKDPRRDLFFLVAGTGLRHGLPEPWQTVPPQILTTPLLY